MSAVRLFIVIILSNFFFHASAYADLLAELKEGNERFINGKTLCYNVSEEERTSLAQSQYPIATIIACSDSRVSPEMIFDQPMGHLFIVRLAGNIVDQFALATIEYGVNVLKTPLIIIMGHQNCGAVKAAFTLKNTNYGANLAALLSEIQPAVLEAEAKLPKGSEAEKLDLAIQYNVVRTHRNMLMKSPIIRDHVKDGSVKIVDALFHIDSGKIAWEMQP